MQEIILFEDVVKLLKEYGELKSFKYLSKTKPGHGMCCTCQECGHHYDECICLNNEIVDKLWKLKKYAEEIKENCR